ncbi:hypothetical protein [Streptomyces daliensis]|uniref:Uncharacterized protein n=1 Tax=Streptomyces daliensis TaxID=299421 RepID=A0A8T4IKS9_9ACTN|nr:hypothetical protein [Streptomyces daliensis]
MSSRTPTARTSSVCGTTAAISTCPEEEAALNRYVIDALTVLDHVTEGHAAVRRYAMEERLPLVTTRTLAV